MTNSEFSNQFDVLYNNIMSNQAPGLDEYEKSVFLTKAQDEVVKAYFDPKGNKYQEGFDGSEKRQIDFSMIMRSASVTSFTAPVLDDRANNKTAALPDDVLMFINEFVTVTRGGASVRLAVVPIDYREYARIMSKPYKRPLKFQAWRMINNTSTNKTAELIVGPNDTLTKYSYRYIKKPQAIILDDLEGVTLDGISTHQECELDPILHEEILQRAVELAKAAYTGDLSSQVALGQTSQTNMGVVTSSSR